MIRPVNLHKCDIAVLLRVKGYNMLLKRLEKVDYEVNNADDKKTYRII